MLRKITLALVAAASLSAVALAPTAASAHWKGGGGFGLGGGFHHHHHWGPGFGIGYVDSGFGGDGCYVPRRVPTPFGFRCARSISADTDLIFLHDGIRRNPGRRKRPGFFRCAARRRGG